jgi:hypothetical protein
MSITSEKNKTEVIFISYEEVIKSPYPVLLQTVLTKYRDFYSKFLDLGRLDGHDINNLARFCIQRSDVNVFEFLAINDFDFENSLIEFKKKFADLYTRSELLKIGQVLPTVMAQRFTEKIYIYSPEYDPRIHLDLQNSLGSMDKISYVVGKNIGEVVAKIPEKITSFILNDIAHVVRISEIDKLKNTSVLLASYGYNYAINNKGELDYKMDIETLSKVNSFEFGTFVPRDLLMSDFALE